MLEKIEGKNVLMAKGYVSNGKVRDYVEPKYILFDDNETYIKIKIHRDTNLVGNYLLGGYVKADSRNWKAIRDNKFGTYPEASGNAVSTLKGILTKWASC